MQTPYVGVTGFMHEAEVSAALDALDQLPHPPQRKLMVGVLASSKTLAGKPNKWPNRYPKPEEIARLFTENPYVVNLIHYATDDRDTLADQLVEVMRLGGEWIDGFQLNIRWPDPASLIGFEHLRIVLQLGSGAMQDIGDDPVAAAVRLDAYRGLITDVLIDASGGRGVPLNTNLAAKFVRAIRTRHPQLGVGIAGGLCASNVDSLRPFLMQYPWTSIDAEGKLRTPQPEDRLDISEMRKYIVDGFFL